MDLKTERRRIGADLAALRFQLALVRQEMELKYRPDQARVPAGSSEGGRWTDEVGALGGIGPEASAPELEDAVFRPEADGAPKVGLTASKPPPHVDLREEEKQGGHAFRRGHVTVADGALIRMLSTERIDTPDFSFLPDAHGSYNDISSANFYTNDVLQRFPDRVASVVSGRKQEDYLEWRYSSPTGREAFRTEATIKSPIVIRPTYSVGVQIKRTGTGKGFVVTTSFPRNRGPR